MEFALGDAIRISTETVNYSDVLTTPDTTMTVEVYHDGTEVLAATAMTNDGAGLHHYIFQSTIDMIVGKYEVYIRSVDDTVESVEHDRNAFYLYD